MDRRTFLKGAVVTAAGSLTCRGDAKPGKTPIGVHIAAHSILDEGVDHSLDLLQESAGVNLILVSSNSYYGAMYRPKEAQGDHGRPIRDGNGRKVTPIFFNPGLHYYKESSLRHGAVDPGLEYAGREIFNELAEPARRRGMKLYERLYEPGKALKDGLIVNGQKVLHLNHEGKPGEKPCWNHPDYRAWLMASLTDLFKAYSLDGIQYGAERLGPVGSMLLNQMAPFCFCDFCKARGTREGIDVERARKGMGELYAWIRAMQRGDARPTDGAFTTFLRYLLTYPEILAWERLQLDSLEEIYAHVMQVVKGANPQAVVGRHMDHAQTSYDLFFRAAVPFQRAAKSAQFIKISSYADIAGPRIKAQATVGYGRTVLGDMNPEQALQAFYLLAGQDVKTEPSLDRIAEEGLSSEYVYREVKRAVEGANGASDIYAACAIDIPRGAGWGTRALPSDPAKIEKMVHRAFDAGAVGLVICREYEEMTIPSLKAIGKALRERKLI